MPAKIPEKKFLQAELKGKNSCSSRLNVKDYTIKCCNYIKFPPECPKIAFLRFWKPKVFRGSMSQDLSSLLCMNIINSETLEYSSLPLTTPTTKNRFTSCPSALAILFLLLWLKIPSKCVCNGTKFLSEWPEIMLLMFWKSKFSQGSISPIPRFCSIFSDHQQLKATNYWVAKYNQNKLT